MANVYRTFWMNPLTGDMMWRRLSGFIEQCLMCSYKWQNTVSHYNVFVVSDLYKLLHVHYIIFILKWHIHQLKQDSTAFGRYTCLEMETFSSVFLCLLPEGFFFFFLNIIIISLGFSHCFYAVIYYIGWWSCGSSRRASEWGAVYRWAWQHRHQKGQLSHPTSRCSQQSHFNIHEFKWNNHFLTAVTKWLVQ